LSSKGLEKKHFIVTDLENRILALSSSATINFRNISGEYNRVWGATYIGNIQAKVGDKLFAVSFADSCYSITQNFINIRKRNPNGGRLQLSDGTTAQLLCFTSGIPQTKLVATTGGGGDNSKKDIYNEKLSEYTTKLQNDGVDTDEIIDVIQKGGDINKTISEIENKINSLLEIDIKKLEGNKNKIKDIVTNTNNKFNNLNSKYDNIKKENELNEVKYIKTNDALDNISTKLNNVPNYVDFEKTINDIIKELEALNTPKNEIINLN
jgi:hypothetical protein